MLATFLLVVLLVVAATPAYRQDTAPAPRANAVYVELLGMAGSTPSTTKEH